MSICSWILHVAEIRWHLELVWASKMAYSLDCLPVDADFAWELTQTTDRVLYTCFVRITQYDDYFPTASIPTVRAH